MIKNIFSISNVIWLSTFFLPFIIKHDYLVLSLNKVDMFFIQPWSTLVGLGILLAYFINSNSEVKIKIVRWTAPIFFWSLMGLKANGFWNIQPLQIGFIAMFIAFALTILYHETLKDYFKSESLSKSNEGLISDDPIDTEEENSFGRTRYAGSVVSEIKKTVNKRAFNIAITGAWGSGKTSFLNLMKNEMNRHNQLLNEMQREHFIIIDYNPWDFKEDKIIGLDLLKTISHKLANEKELQDKFKGLMLSLQGMNQSPWYKVIPFLISGYSKDKSINEYRKEIGAILVENDQKLVIFLDDLDRLDGNEILEIFKTIRNSFNIANTFFILGFDIDYVDYQIEEKVLGSGSEKSIKYLEKIFQMKLFMPSISDYSYYNEYKSLLKSELKIVADIDWNYSINTKRRVFQLINSIKVFFNKEKIDDYNLKALQYIECLKIHDPFFYDYIINNLDKILNGYNSIGSISVITSSNESYENSYSKFTSDLSFNAKENQNSLYLIDQFFNKLDINKSYNIGRDEFIKYFKYSMQNGEFSISILNEVVSKNNSELLYNNISEINKYDLFNKLDIFIENNKSNDWLIKLFINLLYKDQKYYWLYGKKHHINQYETYGSIDKLENAIYDLNLQEKILFLTKMDNKNKDVNNFLISLYQEYFNGDIDDTFWLAYHSLKDNDPNIYKRYSNKFLNITEYSISKNYLDIFQGSVTITPLGKTSASRINHTDPSYYYLNSLFSAEDWIDLIPNDSDERYVQIKVWLENLDDKYGGMLDYTAVFGKDYFERMRPNLNEEE